MLIAEIHGVHTAAAVPPLANDPPADENILVAWLSIFRTNDIVLTPSNPALLSAPKLIKGERARNGSVVVYEQLITQTSAFPVEMRDPSFTPAPLV